MAKRLTEKQKEKILKNFLDGKTVEDISEEFNFTKLTISRNLKKNLGELKFKNLINKNKLKNDKIFLKKIKQKDELKKEKIDESKNKVKNSDEYSLNFESFSDDQFVEITPLDYQIDNTPQKDLSSYLFQK